MINLKDLNKDQQKAVQCWEGPVLVLAGAGSGKTRVITYRIAYLLQERIAKPWEIFAVTFTNKAAREMQERVTQMATGEFKDGYLGTFHAFGARFLRRHAEAFERSNRFTIYDDDDKSRLLRNVTKAQLPESVAKSILTGLKSYIEKVKNSMQPPENFPFPIGDPNALSFPKLFKDYNRELARNNAFDFDDLISLPCTLLGADPNLCQQYRNRFRFVLIDEFQDTNFPQGELARLLTAPSGNITAVGDDDQSIYGWRGAYLGNILQFEKDFCNVKIFRLEQNYRSTKAILNVAHQIIVKNRTRHAKKLWTERSGGEKPVVIQAFDDREEARLVIEKIHELTGKGKYNFGNCVVLYRTNAQSRIFEDTLRRNQMPYIVVGGLRFYERKEIKDFLAYLRLLANPNDIVSLQRVINLPTRGIGAKTLATVISMANSSDQPLFELISNPDRLNDLSRRSAEKLKHFSQMITSLSELCDQESLFKVGEKLLRESGLLEHYRQDEPDEFQNRADNISELLNALKEYSHASSRSGREDLEDFLQEVALVTDVDRWNPQEQAVTLMTLHAVKGLEFSVVFLTGLEDGLFPLLNFNLDQSEIEEERRLFYVGTTRAKDLLFFTYARNRMRWGKEVPYQMPSRFLKEIPDDLLEFGDVEGNTQLFPAHRGQLYKPKIVEVLQKKPSDPSLNSIYTIGCRVLHAQFGEGVLLQSEGKGSDLRLLVNFEKVGKKLLLAEYAKLTLLTN
jgi:DNA helicase II / ATP-dependent DNA helicase PcrA